MATREELEADRAALVNARTSLLTGQSVREVWRDGRRLIFNTVTIDSINDAIAEIDRQLGLLDQEATGKRRRRALSVNFG